MEKGLGLKDGFMFGCGFILASVVASILLSIGVLVLSLILSLLGISLLGGFGNIMGSALPLPFL